MKKRKVSFAVLGIKQCESGISESSLDRVSLVSCEEMQNLPSVPNPLMQCILFFFWMIFGSCNNRTGVRVI